ncbi:Membrane protein TMS1 [Ceratocystis lukuohia]|uniref:Membrane protein TMS1 n=1 Tax=Ceratocystis lukuohia TaxID=2019550 RepID=A0ABR4MII0_9PEZI
MGAVASVPFMALPAAGTLMSFMGSCCGAATCSMVCGAFGKCGNSIATRIAYAMILLINSILAWIMLTPWAIEKLQHVTFDYVTITCPNGQCHGWLAAHRVSFSLGIFHLILCGLLFGVTSSKQPRAVLQNAFWGPKILLWLLFIVVSFLIPDTFFIFWGNYVAMVGGMLFLILGLVLLIDLAHNWAEYCVEQVDQTGSRLWRTVLIGSTLGMYVASLAMTIVQYIFFARGDCSMNQAAITINLLLWLIVSFVSVHPVVQEYNPRAGLAQSAMVAVYCTYLTMSAVSMEPDDKHCNPLVRAQGTRTTSVVIGAIVTMLTVAYTTTRAATQSLGFGSSGSSGAIRLSDDEHDMVVTSQPSVRREMRANALRLAVEQGSLPASALLSDDDDDDLSDTSVGGSGPSGVRDDERTSTKYNYAGFHIIFFLATCWVATLLTMNWQDDTKNGDFATVGRTYAASWVKIVSAWVCYGMYAWSLVAPAVWPERFDF